MLVSHNMTCKFWSLMFLFHSKFSFLCISWGNTVNVASRMDSTGTAGVIQCTEEVYQLLKVRVVYRLVIFS